MEIFKQIAPLKAFLSSCKQQGLSIGLVPTMGALHEGHLSLIEASRQQNQVTVCTVFVNPTQFNNPVDLQKYPRTLDKDILLLKKVGCEVLFCPENDEMYESSSIVKFNFGHLENVMEGKFRPDHFSGVALVVSKLFHIVDADHAYFGQKDWQQFAIIRQLVHELKFNLTLHSVPIAREKDGLAMSSRNLRLNATQRKNALAFYAGLTAGKKALLEGKPVELVKHLVKEQVQQYAEMVLEYFEVADSKNLTLLKNVKESDQPILCIAGYAGEVRLIDNMFLDSEN